MNKWVNRIDFESFRIRPGGDLTHNFAIWLVLPQVIAAKLRPVKQYAQKILYFSAVLPILHIV